MINWSNNEDTEQVSHALDSIFNSYFNREDF